MKTKRMSNTLTTFQLEQYIAAQSLPEGYSLDMIKGKCRKRELADLRHALWYVLFADGYRIMEIARCFDRTHPTVIDGIHKIKSLLEVNDRQVKKLVENISS